MRKIALMIGGLLLAGTSCANAEDVSSPKWADVGSWKIHVDRDEYGCFAISIWERGAVLRIGFDKEWNGYLSIARANAWQALEPGKQYLLTLQFDNEPEWTGKFTASQNSVGRSYLYIKFDSPKFMTEFAVRQSLAIWYDQKSIIYVTLRGSYAALQDLRHCQRNFDAPRNGRSPPSSSSKSAAGQPISDPFGGLKRPDPFE